VPDAPKQPDAPAGGGHRVQVHGTTVAIRPSDGPGPWVSALIRGRSGSGKSDLALRCLSLPQTPLTPFQVRLVADDRTDITIAAEPDGTFASGPATIRGLLEVRGLGILAVPYLVSARLVLVVDLVDLPPRYPDATTALITLAQITNSCPNEKSAPSVRFPHLKLAPFEASAPLKLLLALARTAQNGTPVGADAAKPHHLPEGL
jgi:HPr kinase/phosphorylase